METKNFENANTIVIGTAIRGRKIRLEPNGRNKKSKAILHGGIKNAIIGVQEILKETTFYEELEKIGKE